MTDTVMSQITGGNSFLSYVVLELSNAILTNPDWSNIVKPTVTAFKVVQL